MTPVFSLSVCTRLPYEDGETVGGDGDKHVGDDLRHQSPRVEAASGERPDHRVTDRQATVAAAEDILGRHRRRQFDLLAGMVQPARHAPEHLPAALLVVPR